MATIPDLAMVREYLSVPATVLSDADLQRMMDAAQADQAARCLVPDDPAAFPASLAQAFLRRVQREVASRNLPLGMVGVDAESGPQTIPALDAQVAEHERAFRLQVLA